MKPRLLIAALLCASAGFSGQQPRSVPNGCDYGQILGLEHNQTIVICSASAAQIPAVLAQLKRLNELAAEDERDRRALHRFVEQINATANLLKNRDNELVRNVYALLRDAAQHSDSRVIQDLSSLTDRMDQVVGRLNALQQDPATAARLEQVLASGVGEDLATLHPDQAAQILESIGLLNKKIDDLATRIDCSAATPKAMATAIDAHLATRVIDIWRCRPENVVTNEVDRALMNTFLADEFPKSKNFLDQLINAGFPIFDDLKPLHRETPRGVLTIYTNTPVYQALVDGNLDLLRWVIARAPSGYWTDYPTLMQEIIALLYTHTSKLSAESAVHVISELRSAGVRIDGDNYAAYRATYRFELLYDLPKELRTPLAQPSEEQRIITRQLGGSLKPYPDSPRAEQVQLYKMVGDALAPNSPEILHSVQSAVLQQLIGKDLDDTNKAIQDLTQQLTGRTWYRKLPETPASLQEAATRQNVNAFDSFGYTPVARGDVRDDDVIPNFSAAPVGYPNCPCRTAKQFRDQLARASQRREKLLEFQAAHQ